MKKAVVSFDEDGTICFKTKIDVSKQALNALIGLFGHDFSNSNSHYFTTECKYAMMAMAKNPDLKVKYVYHEEFFNDTNNEPINFEESSIYEFVTDKKPLCYHVFNMKRNKHCQNNLPFFYKIYNVSAVKMHKLAQHVGGCVRGIFTDTLIISNPERVPEFNTDVIGGVRKSKISESDLLLNTTPRTKNFNCERPSRKVLKKINDFKLSDGKGCYIKGKGGCGKSTLCNKLQEELGEGKYAVCTPTHKSTLKIGAVTILLKHIHM